MSLREQRGAKHIATSTLWQFASQITMAALSILTVKFVAMGLTKELAGNYNSAYGYLQLFGILADFGLYAVSVREVSKAPENSKTREEVLGALIVLRFCILLLSLGSALLLVWILPQWRETPLPMSVLIASLVPFFTLLAGIVRTVFQVEYKMHYVFIAEVVQRIITAGMIGGIILMGVRGSNDLHILHLMLFIGGVGAYVLFHISLSYGNTLIRIRPHINTALMKSLVTKAAPFGIAYLFVAFYRQFDITLIAFLRPDFELQNAYYGFVARMSDMGFLLPTFLLNSTLPILSERESKGNDTATLLGKTFFSILIIGIVSFLFAALWSRPLIQLLTTDQYLATAQRAGSDTALRLISIPLLLNGIILYSFYVLLHRHVWKRLVITLGCAAAMSLILNVFLIPQFGFVGAAYTSIIVHVMLACLLLPQALREMPLKMPGRRWRELILFTGTLAGGLFIFAPLLTYELSTVIGLIAMTGLMVGLLWGLRWHTSLL